MRRKTSLSLVLTIILLASTLLMALPKASTATPIVKLVMSKDDWINLARLAWNYYKPGVAVEYSTGLHHAGKDWPYFTDWDLGTYILAILDAEKLGLISRDGEWGSTYRLNKIISFLKTRRLTDEGIPYLWYDSRNGEPWGTTPTNPSDSGRLLVALHRLRLERPEYRDDIEYIVKVRTNYAAIASSNAWGGPNPYYYYAALGFKYFGFDQYEPVKRILEGFKEALNTSERVLVEDIDLPKMHLTMEPIIHLYFETEYDPMIEHLLFNTYLAHYNRYNRIGELLAFSEGNTGLDDPSYVYEWMVVPNGDTWVITKPDGTRVDISPISYLKVAISFHAIYPSEYTVNLLNMIFQAFEEYYRNNPGDPCKNYACGYMEGVDLNGRVVHLIIDRTNGLVLEAARYAVDKGMLKIETSPPVPATLYVDGQPRDPWGLDYLPILTGTHHIRFGDVGHPPFCDFYVTPADQDAQVSADEITIARGEYELAGLLVVKTDPPVPATIYLNGTPVAAWGLDYLPVKPGKYVIRFGDVPYYVTPPDQIVEVRPKEVTTVVGHYVKAGLLVVKTNPAVPSVIYLNGTPVAVWGLDYLPVKPGVYLVSFGDVDGYETPAPILVEVKADEIVTVIGNFTRNPEKTYPKNENLGFLKIETNPPVPATLYVNGTPRDPWGLDYLPLPPGKYVIRFGDVGLPLCDYYVTPPDVIVEIRPGEVTKVIGNYTLAGLLVIKTDPPVPATLYVNGTPVDPWGLDYLPVKPGTYIIRFGDVPYYVTPKEVVVKVEPKKVTTAVGHYVKAGLLVVKTNPAVASTIYLNGTPVAVWGLDYLPVKPGTYYIYFSPIEGYNQPNIMKVVVNKDEVVEVVGEFT